MDGVWSANWGEGGKKTLVEVEVVEKNPGGSGGEAGPTDWICSFCSRPNMHGRFNCASCKKTRNFTKEEKRVLSHKKDKHNPKFMNATTVLTTALFAAMAAVASTTAAAVVVALLGSNT